MIISYILYILYILFKVVTKLFKKTALCTFFWR